MCEVSLFMFSPCIFGPRWPPVCLMNLDICRWYAAPVQDPRAADVVQLHVGLAAAQNCRALFCMLPEVLWLVGWGKLLMSHLMMSKMSSAPSHVVQS